MIKERIFFVSVKARAKKTELLGFDKDKNAYAVAVAAPPEGNKANLELVKFLSKLIGSRVRIRKGLRGKVKLVEAA